MRRVFGPLRVEMPSPLDLSRFPHAWMCPHGILLQLRISETGPVPPMARVFQFFCLILL